LARKLLNRGPDPVAHEIIKNPSKTASTIHINRMFQLLYTNPEFCRTSILIVALIFMQDSGISRILHASEAFICKALQGGAIVHYASR
jgi:hypothetical protein